MDHEQATLRAQRAASRSRHCQAVHHNPGTTEYHVERWTEGDRRASIVSVICPDQAEAEHTLRGLVRAIELGDVDDVDHYSARLCLHLAEGREQPVVSRHQLSRLAAAAAVKHDGEDD